jgi:hypothetical protein
MARSVVRGLVGAPSALLAVALSGAIAGCTEGTSLGSLPDASFVGLDATGDAPSVLRPDGGPAGECTFEGCGDGLDGDCDGIVDEGCACIPGEESSCFRGALAQRGVGACVDGTMRCTDGLEFGTWGACEGDVAPSDEVCDGARADEDCDGAVNEGCDCDPSPGPVPCGTDVGACAPGTQTCEAGRLGACTGAIGPSAETCNAIDDDCDGTTDEGITRSCGTDVGECTAGTETCVAGAFAG